MTNYCTLSDNEILAIMGKAMRHSFATKDLQDVERENKRRVKADFFNLDNTDYCTFK